MDIGSLLLALALIILVAAFVARPVIEQAATHREAASSADDLIARREAVLIELRDLDFDHDTGKVGDDDYAEQRARLVAKGAEVLRALDALEATKPASASTGFDDAIEKAVAAVRTGKSSKSALAEIDDEIEKAVAAVRRGDGKAKAAHPSSASKPAGAVCPQCSQPTTPADRFCAKCGASLTHICATCGQPFQPGDKFCARCGARLPVATEAA